MQSLFAIAIILGTLVLTARRVDVRLALSLGALGLFGLMDRLPDFFGTFAREMANPATIVPIGSAMGFSYVLRETGCDLHLIRMMLRPLRYVRALIVPGGIVVGYLVNTTLVSQTSAAAVVGPILIPLLRAGGASRVTAGAALLLGCSMGGELFNPGAVEVATLADLTGAAPTRVVSRVAPWNLLAASTGLGVFWALDWRRRRRATEIAEAGPEGATEGRVNVFRAMVPLVPIVLLFTVPKLVELPEKAYPRLAEPASILTAMLIGSALAGLSAPSKLGRLGAAFFEGAGYGYIHVISLIVTATVFTEGIKASGLIDLLVASLTGARLLAVALAIVLPWGLARVCGSGIAPAVAVMKALVPESNRLGLDALHLGAITSVAAHLGRTMSPAAAVVAMCATLSSTDRDELLRRVTPPLLAGLVVLLVTASLR